MLREGNIIVRTTLTELSSCHHNQLLAGMFGLNHAEEDKSVKVPVPSTCLNCSDFIIVTMHHLVPQLPISVCTEKRLSKADCGLIGLRITTA